MTKTLDEHYGYLSDSVKLERYRAAIERCVRPEHAVIDLGCGSGVLGLMALRCGARKVLFVDEGAVIEIARRSVEAAGFADRAAFFQANSFELALPERVDVIVCDHVGYFGFDYGILALLADAQARFLKPGGVIVPSAIDLELAPVESAACRQFVERWRDGSVPGEYAWLAEPAANTAHAVGLEGANLLANAETLATLWLGEEAAPYLTWTAEFTSERDGMLDGVGGWFDCRLDSDVRMSNSPSAAEPISRPQALLPLPQPAAVRRGDVIRATVMVRHIDQLIGWVVELPGSGQRFAQSTFGGLLLDREAIERARPDRVAGLNARGRARQLVLSCCDGRRTAAEIEALVQREHPDLFPSAQATASFVRRVLSWDTSE